MFKPKNKMSKIISNETIENLKQLFRNRASYFDIKEVFDNLEDSKDELIIKDLKSLLKNKGRSSILESDIREIINKYDILSHPKGWSILTEKQR